MIRESEKLYIWSLLTMIIVLNAILNEYHIYIEEGFNPVKEIKKLAKKVDDIPGQINGTVHGVVNGAINGVRGQINSVSNSLSGQINSVSNSLNNTIRSVERGINNTIKSVERGINNTIKSIENAFKQAIAAINKLIASIEKTIKKVIKEIKELPRTIANGVISLIPNKKIKSYFKQQTKEKNMGKMLLNLCFGIFKLIVILAVMPYLMILAMWAGVKSGMTALISSILKFMTFMVTSPPKPDLNPMVIETTKDQLKMQGQLDGIEKKIQELQKI